MGECIELHICFIGDLLLINLRRGEKNAIKLIQISRLSVGPVELTLTCMRRKT